MISAEILVDSQNKQGQRLTTFVLTFPRIVLAEFNTHRMISRNSASSRAIPFHKMVERCKEDPFIPIKWMIDHPGMQGTEYLEEHNVKHAITEWLDARDAAIHAATQLHANDVTKQIVNRLLEPFMWHTVIATGTDWENFFALRAHEAAEIHIQDLAYKMLQAYNASKPTKLEPGEWHIPFGDKIEHARLLELMKGANTIKGGKMLQEFKIKIATARCARISYNNFEGKDDYEADIKLHDRLADSGHWSPFEHCAKAMDDWEYENNYISIANKGGGRRGYLEGYLGNFRGFVQYRKLFLEQENKTDSRIYKLQSHELSKQTNRDTINS